MLFAEGTRVDPECGGDGAEPSPPFQMRRDCSRAWQQLLLLKGVGAQSDICGKRV